MAAIREAIRNGDGRTSEGAFRDLPEAVEEATYHSLIFLVSALPAPPEVRAAAFRALATYPDVQNLGDVPGGQGLLLPGDHRLVIDPTTGRVNETSLYFHDRGVIVMPAKGSDKITAEWTDTVPR